MLPIAVDAMGGDHAPQAIVDGVIGCVTTTGISVLLVGPADQLRRTFPQLGEHADQIQLVDASEVIEMDEDPGASVRRKKDSSLVRTAELVRDGQASAMVSAGNTGATMASALLRIGRIKGVSRPAIAAVLPTRPTPTVLLDAGANADVQAEWLVDFAVLGSAYASTRFGIERPRVSLLSIGEEPGKGNQQTKDVFALLEKCAHINFVGNCEGRDLLSGRDHVVVCDGFVGNVALKTLEGALIAIGGEFARAASTRPALTDNADFGAAMAETYAHLSPDSRGGAMLLGIDGIAMVCHGSSSPHAIASALRVTNELVNRGLIGSLNTAITRLSS